MEDIIKVIKGWNVDVQSSEREMSRLKARIEEVKVDRDNAILNLKILHKALNQEIRQGDESVYFDKFECEGATIKCRKLPASVVVTESDALSDKFVRVTTSPDKKAIKQALDAGEEVKGAELSPETYKLEVEV